MKCAVCHERKGKRGCKLVSMQFVCPSCCALTRRDECEGCGYYEISLEYQREKRVRSKSFITEVIDDLDDQCDEALALIQKGDIARGQALIEDLQREHPNYHSVLYAMGVCHGVKGELDEAISCLERAVEIYPPFAHAYYNMGTSYCQKFDLENAVKSYEMAIAADGSNGEIRRKARKQLDDLEAAVKASGITLSTHIRNRRIFDRGFLALQEGKCQAAIDLFAQVLATEKNHVQSYGNMGLAYAILGNRQKALECLDKAIELDPGYEPALVNRLAIASLKEGEALSDFDGHELSYYSEFKLRGRSYVQHLVDELKAGRK